MKNERERSPKALLRDDALGSCLHEHGQRGLRAFAV